MLPGLEGVEHHQARVIDPAVGVLEAAGDAGAEPVLLGEGHPSRSGQALPPPQVVVEEEARAQHPGRPQVRAVGQDEAQRPDDVGGLGQQYLAFAQGLVHQAKLAMLQIAQAAMDQLAAGRGGGAGQVGLLAQRHPQAASGGIDGDAGAVDAAPDDEEIDHLACLAAHGCLLRD